MKPLRVVLAGALAAAVAACVPKQEAPPRPEPQPPVRQPQYVPPPPPPPPAMGWRDVPLTPGNWYYRGEGAATQAVFGVASSEPVFVLQCDTGSRNVTLSRTGSASGNMMTIRTTETARNLPVTPQLQPTPYTSTTLPAQDRVLDAIAFSRGRFTVEVPGTQMLVIPAWPEAARVVEDCRG